MYKQFQYILHVEKSVVSLIHVGAIPIFVPSNLVIFRQNSVLWIQGLN